MKIIYIFLKKRHIELFDWPSNAYVIKFIDISIDLTHAWNGINTGVARQGLNSSGGFKNSGVRKNHTP